MLIFFFFFSAEKKEKIDATLVSGRQLRLPSSSQLTRTKTVGKKKEEGNSKLLPKLPKCIYKYHLSL